MKYIAYYRVSTKKQGLGLDAQKTSVQEYRDKVGGDLVGEYSEKETGKNNRRPSLMNAIAECKKQNATLIIAKLDRLSRNVSFIFALRDSGVDFVALDLPTLNTLTLGVYATIAQHEREITAERTRKALAELKSRGVKLGAPNAFISTEMRERSADALREIAQTNENNRRARAVVVKMRNEGHTLKGIADWLNDNSFYTSQGRQFTPTAVRRLYMAEWG